jgi:hypothetical protein
MAVNRQTTWADTTEVAVTTAATWVKGVEVTVQEDSTAEVYVQLFNATGVTPGTTAPNVVLPIPAVTADNRKKRKYVFPGGLAFGIALEWFVSTTHDGATAPTTDNLPLEAILYYEPMV